MREKHSFFLFFFENVKMTTVQISESNPERELRPLAQVNSHSPFRLALAPSARLFGRSGEVINVQFLLTNLGPTSAYFVASAGETAGGQAVGQGFDPDKVNFPVPQFLETISETRPYVRSNETKTVSLTLRVPEAAPVGTTRMISLELQPQYSSISGN